MDPAIIQKPLSQCQPREVHEHFIPPTYCREAQRRTNEISTEEQARKDTVLNPGKILILVEKLTDDCSKPLEVKVNRYLMKESESEVTFLIHLLPRSEEAMVQVIGTEELEKSLRFPISENVMKNIVKCVNERWVCNETLDSQILTILHGLYKHYEGKTVIVPIMKKGRVTYHCSTENVIPLFLVCFINSQTHQDTLRKVALQLFKYCQTLLVNTIIREEETLWIKRYQFLLISIREMFNKIETTDDLFKNIVFEARKVMNARRCSLLLLDADQVKFIKKAFECDSSNKFGTNLHVVKDQRIAKKVAVTGKVLNIKNAEEHPLFDRTLDGIPTEITRNILCFPLRDEKSIIGVIQLCNKRGGDFTYEDEDIAKIFGIHCGVSIAHNMIYKQMKETQERIKLYNDLLIHHNQVTEEELTSRLKCCLIHNHDLFDQFEFPPKEIMPRETSCFIMRMIEELGFIESFSIKKHLLMKFILLVQKSHAPMPYHNWMLSFSITHFAYLTLKKFKILEKDYISKLEGFAFILACLCSSLDHRGINNPFNQKPYKDLAAVYSSPGSVMQRHHFSQAMAILNSEGCNFLDSLNYHNYDMLLTLFKDLLLAGDLVVHYKLYRKQYLMVTKGYNKQDALHRYLFVCLLKTCATFADQVKDWPQTKQSVTEIFEELVTLGHIKGEQTPILLPFDHLKLVSELQVDFLSNNCLSSFKLLSLLFPEARHLVDRVKMNMLRWEASRSVFKQARHEDRTFLEVLKGEQLDKEVGALMDALRKSK